MYASNDAFTKASIGIQPSFGHFIIMEVTNYQRKFVKKDKKAIPGNLNLQEVRSCLFTFCRKDNYGKVFGRTNE